MTAGRPNPGSFEGPDAHVLRAEGRRLIQACLDREISAESPRLRALLEADAQLRHEFDEFRRLDAMLQQPSPATDISASILAELQDRPVFLPTARRERSIFENVGFGIAAALAFSAGTFWLTLAALRTHTPTQSIAQTDLVSDAREAIRNTVATPHASQPHSSYVIAPTMESSVVPDFESIVETPGADPRTVANQMAGSGAVRIERTGLSFVNPGPDRFSSATPSRRARAAVLQWNTQPDAMYSGSKFQRSDVYRASGSVTGWYDKEGSYVPVTGAGAPK